MAQRGVTRREVENVIEEGWLTSSAKPGTWGRRKVFVYNKEWEGRTFEEKEVTVYFKIGKDGDLLLLTVVARYGSDFPRGIEDEG